MLLQTLLGKRIKKINSTTIKKLIKTLSFGLSQKLKSIKSRDENGLITQIENEIKEAETRYEPVSQSDKEAFLSSNRWVLFEQENSLNMELRRSTGEFDISVRFSSKAPEEMTKEKEENESGMILFIKV